MRRSIILLALLAVVPGSAHAQDPADREAAMLEMSYFFGRGKLDTLQLWCEAAEEVKELAVDEDLNDKEINRKLRIARGKLKKITAMLGREIKIKFFCTDRSAWIETTWSKKKKTYVVIRLDTDPMWFATWDNKGKTANKVGLTMLKGNRVNESIKYNFDGLSGKKLSIVGRKSVFYSVGGGLGGKMYVSEEDKKALSVVQLFCEKARDKMGGYRAELIWAVADSVQHLPIIGTVSLPRGGWTWEGGQGRGQKIGFAMRDALHRKKGDDDWDLPKLEIPGGKDVKEKHLPKK